MVNAWGRGDALPETDNDTARRFGVEVVFVGSDGTEEVHYTNFSPDILDWQFLSDVYVAKAAYTSIKVSYTYCHNANLAYFAGLSLFREEYGQTYVYDEDNNIISVTDAQEQSRTFEYSSSQDLTGITDAKGNEFTYEYDSNHNVTKGTSAENMVYKLTYDSNGNVVKSGAVSSADETTGTWMTRTFTSDGNHVASVTDARGCTASYTWNTKKDLITKVTDANGNAVSYTYDTKNRLTKVSQSVTNGSTAQTVSAAYGYTKDKLTSITHNGFQYGFAYDGYGRAAGVTAAGNSLAAYEYEEKNGNLTKLTYGNGDSIRYVYDDQDRLAEEYLCSAGATAEQLLRSYVYDTEGNLYQVTDHSCGKTYTLSYDLLDRLVRVTDENGSDYQCFYDAENSLTQLRHAADDTYRNTKYTYDKDSRETKTTTGTVSRSTSYDAWGRVSEQVWDRNANDIYQMTYEYPDSGVNKIVLPSAVTRGTVRTEYVYDGNGNITSLTEGDKATTYVYDELNRLIRENNAVLNKTITYSYDVGGNLVEEKEYAFTTGTLPASAIKTTTGTYSSTWKDQLLSWNGVSMTYDGSGNMLTKGSTAYTWTQGRRLSAVENGKSIKYYYDHTGARVKKDVDGTVTEYRMAGRLIVSEKTGSSTQWYHYDSAGNPYAAGIGGIRYYFLRNLQGDVVGLIDASGDVVVEYQYDSWGNTISITGSLADTVGQKNPFRYRGYYYDTETGLYYVGSRYYDAGIRRWINADTSDVLTIGFENFVQYNLFAYCFNNPVNMIDNTGTWPTLAQVFTAAVATVATVVAAAAVIAAAPAIAGAVVTAASFYGASAAVTGALATATNIGCVGVAAGVSVTGVNRTVETLTGTNYGAKILGEKNYRTFENTVNFAAMVIISAPQAVPYPSTGRTQARNLKEQVGMNFIKKYPDGGSVVLPYLHDSRMPGWLGWQKYQMYYDKTGVCIHYVGNRVLPIYFDFKFKE